MKKRANGTGNIRKVTKNGKEYWEASITIGNDPGSGAQKKKYFSGKTQKEVREKMQAAAVAVQNNDYFEPKKITLSEWLDIWLKDYSSEWKWATKTKYENVCRNHIRPKLGSVKLYKLTAPEIQGFYNELFRSGFSAKSVRLYHGILSKALNTALRIGYIRNNPAALCTVPKLIKKEIKPLTEDNIRAFVKVCDNEYYGKIYKLILFTGLRESEALGITWDCVDFDNNELKIEKQLQQQDGKNVFVPLKNNKTRYLTAAPYVMQLLKQEQTEQKKRKLAAGDFWQSWQTTEEQKTALVFTKEDGSVITRAALYHRYKHIVEALGIPEARVHDLRHTYALLALQNGDNIKTVQSNLGHATAAFTLDVYGHISERMKTDSADKMQHYIEAIG